MTTKRQHYIPQYYLKGFCSQSSKICVYDISSQPTKIICTGIKNVASENYFYSYTSYNGTRDIDSVEKELASIEYEANKILPKLIDRLHLSDDEKYKISIYLCVMWSRVHSFRQIVDDHIKKMDIEPIIEQWRVSAKNATAEREEWLRQILNDSKKETPNHMYTPVIIPAIVDILWRMNWYYIKSSSPIVLVGDNPFLFTSSKGLGAPDAEFFIPISKDCILWGCKKRPSNQNQWFCFANNDVVIEKANEWQIKGATKYIFHGEKQDWIIELINNLIEPVPADLEQELLAFADLSDEVLWGVTRSTLSSSQQARLAELNELGQERSLTTAEQAEQEALAEAYGRLIVRRGEAAVQLKRRGYDLSDPITLKVS